MATQTNLPASFVSGAVLTASQQNDLRGAFRILQVVSPTNNTSQVSTSGTWTSTGVSATITPQSTSSKIFVVVNMALFVDSANATGGLRIQRASSVILTYATALYTAGGAMQTNVPLITLDSPASTSALTYSVDFQKSFGTAIIYAQYAGTPSTITLFEVSA
jgi:hypothetical protein